MIYVMGMTNTDKWSFSVKFIEQGDIYFFYKPKKEVSSVRSIEDVSRFYFVMDPKGKALPRYIEEVNAKASTGDCYAVCVQEPTKNTNKIKTQVEHIVNKGTSKWILKYSVYEYDSHLRSFPTKGDAVKYARAQFAPDIVFNLFDVLFWRRRRRRWNNLRGFRILRNLKILS